MLTSSLEFNAFGKFLEQSRQLRLQRQEEIRTVHTAAGTVIERATIVLGGQNAVPVFELSPAEAIYLSTVYEHDDRHWRELFRQLVYTLSEIVPAWQFQDKERQHMEMFKCVYDYMDHLMWWLTRREKDFRINCFQNEFLPAMQGRRPPYGVWRKINLCCCSPFWKSVTVTAIQPLVGYAARCESIKLGIMNNVRIQADGTVVFPEPNSEVLECLQDADVLRDHCIQYLEVSES